MIGDLLRHGAALAHGSRRPAQQLERAVGAARAVPRESEEAAQQGPLAAAEVGVREEAVHAAVDHQLGVELGDRRGAEWPAGGLPAWLDDVPGLVKRSNNTQWLNETQRWMAAHFDHILGDDLFLQLISSNVVGVVLKRCVCCATRPAEEPCRHLGVV